ncbi:type II toxin-antitoxin system Phd/YefM family antitoxin [Ottowia sp.]|uniref:type II toxin-antitoxin system Phd/YefM family antitoxin n=1 Tax=Ottowia sp. TaxID=1898956 RepID=UPI00393941CD|nr:type II toxin-antitoxin system Phd/YefM family antitoxin [Pseudomonadota bacterium]
MSTLTASEARANFYRLMDQAAQSHEPIFISGKRSNSVLLAQEDWAAIQETLYLLSVPNMRESIKSGMAEPTDSCATELDW